MLKLKKPHFTRMGIHWGRRVAVLDALDAPPRESQEGSGISSQGYAHSRYLFDVLIKDDLLSV